MAEKRSAGKKPAKVEKKISTGLYEGDVEKLSQVKQLEGHDSIAETFRIKFGELLDNVLIEAAERRAEAIRKGRQ